MPETRVFIVEDEFLHLENTKLAVEACGYQIIGESGNADEAESAILNASPDIILMDISLPGKLNGISLSQKIKGLGIPIIFTTSFSDEETMLEAAEVNPNGYLIKPIDAANLKAAIVLALNYTQSKSEDGLEVSEKSVLIKSGNKLQKIELGDILWIEAAGDHYSKIVTDKYQLVSRHTLKQMSTLLNMPLFIQVHRAYMVNLQKIDSIHEKEQVIHIGSHEVPIGRTYKEGLYSQFSKL